MTTYVLRRLLHGLISIVIVVLIVMLLVYSMMDRDNILSRDPLIGKRYNNALEDYKYSRWELFGYLDYVTFADYLNMLQREGEIDASVKTEALKFGKSVDGSEDTPEAAEYVTKFTEYYEAKGYTVVRRAAVMSGKRLASGGKQTLFAYRDIPLAKRAVTYFTKLIQVDNVHYVDSSIDIGARKLTFTLHDPAAGGKFSPAVMGNGTLHKYLLYFDSQFPYIHQNLFSLKLGLSFVQSKNTEVTTMMGKRQGKKVYKTVTYPTGVVAESADDLHTATYVEGSRDRLDLNQQRFTDDYTSTTPYYKNRSSIAYSFLIGVISVIAAYVIGIPLGVILSRNKDKLIDKIGTAYVIFILAVPSLAYIFMFKVIGRSMGLPAEMRTDAETALMYVLPIVSLALPSIAGLMKWIRRYMIDQMNSDYVKFARSGGLSEREIFSKHILKNAIIPIVHGIPAAILGSLAGALITERVYKVPGIGGLMTDAIEKYDNAVIVGTTLFYGTLTVISLILGDVLMAMVDPRISFTTEKAR